MRAVYLTARLEEDNKIFVDLKPVDMDDEPEDVCLEIEHIMGIDKLMYTHVLVHGQEFMCVYNPRAKMPPSLHTPEGAVLYGDAMIFSKNDNGGLASLSGGGEKFLYQHLKETIREAIDLYALKNKLPCR